MANYLIMSYDNAANWATANDDQTAEMDRTHGAKEACGFVRRLDFSPSGTAFDAAFDKR